MGTILFAVGTSVAGLSLIALLYDGLRTRRWLELVAAAGIACGMAVMLAALAL